MRKTEIIDLNSFPVKPVLKYLLQDKTTKKNIIFATDTYSVDGEPIHPEEQITEDLLRRMGENPIQPRHVKSRAQQTDRTRKRAEVFTPVWICNKMNNYCDDEWFGRPGSFNTEIDNGRSWKPYGRKIPFPEGKCWKEYIDSTRIDITCGEAPFLVSRYDAADGTPIDISQRIGMLDRKLRIVSENVKTEEEWLKWTFRSFQSVYGYEYQGDNLLIARINLLNTFMDYTHACLHRDPTEKELKKITRIISWNIWQMDGLSGMVPLLKQDAAAAQPSLFVFAGIDEKDENHPVGIQCKIYDWRANRSIEFGNMNSKKKSERYV